LNCGMRIDSLNGLRETLQAIDASNEDVLNASILQFGHD
jgi:hypothetical protein